MIEKKIDYHDTDAIGIVHHGAYINFLEVSRTDFFNSKGIPVKNMHERGCYFVIKKININYKNPSFYGDVVICEIEVDKVTDAQIFLKQRILQKQNNNTLLDAEVVLVLLNEYLKPIVLPNQIKLSLC